MISSKQNPIVKEIAKLRDSKVRRKTGSFLIDTPRDIIRALASPSINVTELYCCGELPIPKDLKSALAKGEVLHNIRHTEFTKPVFESIAYRQNPNGVIAKADIFSTSLDQLALENPTLLLIAEGIEKPGNLGALLRIADAVGVDALITCDPNVDLFNPNVLRASAGAAFGVPYASAKVDEVLEFIRSHQLNIVGASPEAKEDLWSSDLKSPCAIVVGSEAFGVSAKMQKACNTLISLPMKGIGDSLNVSVATAVTLYEAMRQRRS